MARVPAAGKAIAKLRAWAQRADWIELYGDVAAIHLDPACEALGIEPEALFGALDDYSLAMVMGAVFEDFLACEFGEEDRNIIDEYLARRGWTESVSTKRWLKALRDSRVGLWEVVALDPGRAMTLKDLLAGGEPVVVDERTGSRSAALWDRVMARVLTVNGRDHLSGVVLVFAPEAARAVMDRFEGALKQLRRRSRKQARAQGVDSSDAATLRASLLYSIAPVLTQEWLAHTYRAVTALPPDFINADGEALMFAELRFPLGGDAATAANRLDRAPNLSAAGEDNWNWVATEPAATAGAQAKAKGSGRVIRVLGHDDLNRRLMGNVRIDGGAVVLETNSLERAERGRAMLADILGDLVGEPETVMHSPAEVMARPDDRRQAPSEPDLPPEARADILARFADDHYRRCLDEPLPVLDGKAPRAAVRTKKGRAAVAEWLKQLENHDARRSVAEGMDAYDFVWMWKELGIEDLRR